MNNLYKIFKNIIFLFIMSKNDKDINDNIIFGHAATVNPFEEADQRELNNQIHLRYKKRNGKKVWTFIEGLDKETAKKLCKKWRTKWGCSASVKKDEGEIIATLSGDHRGKVFNDLLEDKIVEEIDIKIHGPNLTDV
jgi:translation initiation factor SUI1